MPALLNLRSKPAAWYPFPRCTAAAAAAVAAAAVAAAAVAADSLSLIHK
jgi:hypothetical protein